MLLKKLKCLHKSTLGPKLLQNVKTITDVSSSTDLGDNRMSFYGKLIKKKFNKNLFLIKRFLVVLTKEQFIDTTLYSSVFR